MDYEKLLDGLYATLPAKKTSGERFEIPVADVFLQGNKTVIKNFDFLCTRLRRTPVELTKYFSKELASPGSPESGKLILQGKISSRLVNEKLVFYCESRVLCPECKKPDTHIDLVHGVKTMVCEACGAHKPVN